MERILLREGIAENLRFMVLEVTKQVENTKKALDNYDQKIMDSIASRDDYIDNLKSVVENKCFTAIHSQRAQDKRAVDLVRAANTVANNLERVGDFAVSIVGQIKYLKSQNFIQRYDYPRFFKEVLDALDMVYQAVVKQDLSLAFKICRVENTLDMLYKVQFDRILYELRSGKETENLITSHLILRYLERMGDAILNIGEAIIFAAVGEKFKIRQYHALKETLALSGIDTPITDVEFHSIWGTRSGCRIGYLAGSSQTAEEGEGGADTARKKPSAGVLFKEGNKKKLLQEMENIMRWESILPGLPPRVLAHQEDATQASLLIEFLGGCNFQDVVLTGDPEVVKNAFFLITETLTGIWDQTLAET
ncbi:MAG: phosphate uptake regulator PhoU, partial [Desulfovibrio sp.]|nr:phosphate uptake regulator PhoU [Desulfovibrio sp.]